MANEMPAEDTSVGERLYALYVQAHDEQNIGVDPWEMLPVDDWHIWNRIAQLAMESLPHD